MATPAPGRDELDVLDQLIVRSLVTLRRARAACRNAPTPRNHALRDRAEDELNELLDSWAGARRRVSSEAPSPGPAADRLPA